MARRSRSRRNPVDAAERAYETFHGRRPDETIEVITELREHDTLAGIGKLEWLEIESANGVGVVKLSRFGESYLAMNEGMTQLYVEGGDQSVDLEEFDIDPDLGHETEILGIATRIAYFTTKDHLGRDGGTAVYVHKFGEDGGEGPTVVYDVRNGLLYFAGGSYTIPAEGIEN